MCPDKPDHLIIPEFLSESCATAYQWGLKSIHESLSAEGGKASPLALAYSQFKSIPSYSFLGIFTSHKSKGRCENSLQPHCPNNSLFGRRAAPSYF